MLTQKNPCQLSPGLVLEGTMSPLVPKASWGPPPKSPGKAGRAVSAKLKRQINKKQPFGNWPSGRPHCRSLGSARGHSGTPKGVGPARPPYAWFAKTKCRKVFATKFPADWWILSCRPGFGHVAPLWAYTGISFKHPWPGFWIKIKLFQHLAK